MHNTIDHFLSATDGAGPLMAHLRMLSGLQRAYSQIVPDHLGQASQVVNCKQGVVVIHADNGAVAAKLRQMATRLAGEFVKRGVECSGVQIRVQATAPAPQAAPIPVRPISEATQKTLREAAANLPDPALRAALERLLEHALVAPDTLPKTPKQS
jgi:hypothetical protein